MAGVPIIIQSGKHGLDPAADHYKQFPWEPSPAGDLDLQHAKIVKVDPMTFDKLLVELAKSPPGGTVLIVCHAHDEYNSKSKVSGLLMPLADGAGMSAQDTAFERLREVGAANRRAQTIRAMPSKTDQEKQAKSDAWIGLATDFGPGPPPDDATLPQLEHFFERGLDTVAHQLKLTGGAQGLKSMLEHIEKVQSLNLERVEFRACKIGKDTTTLGHLKDLFGCRKLLAPTARTFYIKGMPVMTIDKFNSHFRSVHPRGHLRPPGPTGSSSNNPDDFTTSPPNDWRTEMLLRNPKTRLFWDVEYGYIPPPKDFYTNPRHPGGSSTIKIKGPVLGMVVEEIGPAWYRAFAAAWHQNFVHRVYQPAWDDASKFVHQYIMPKAKYGSGDIMVAGFWTPGEELPWLLPVDGQYVDHIHQA
ncbi:MAG: hypothetical protein WCA20_33200 [Candidatus Sulfotelmatobacter sp.]